MKITVQIHPNSFSSKVDVVDGVFHIYTKSPAVESRANKEMVELLAKHLQCAKQYISIKRGLKGKNKIVEIDID